MKAIHPSSANTLRIITIVNKHKEVAIIASHLRMGRGGIVVDNASAGGIFSFVNLSNGKLGEYAYNSFNTEKYKEHPDTKVKFENFVIPHWEKLTTYAKKLATVNNNVNFVGWDIAITERGFELVEGN